MQLLIIREHGSPDRVFDLYGEDVVIGRSRSCDLRLANVSVSREHAIVRWEAGEYLVDDKGSHNGVYVNGTRVDSHRLRTGDLVRLGKYELIYVHEQVPRVLQSADIEAMPRWHQVTMGTADDSTFRINVSTMERMIAARRILELGRIILDGEGQKDWTPGEETLVLGRGAIIPLSGLFMGPHVAEILWNGRSHVFKRISRRLKVNINGRAYTDASMLEHGDTIDVGKIRLRYVVG